MGDDTDITNDLGTYEYAALVGAGIFTAGYVWAFGFNVSSADAILTIMTLALLALMLWQFLTNHDNFSDYVKNNQMVAIVSTCVIAATALFHTVVIRAVKSTHS